MIKNADHMTIVVSDINASIHFFELFNFTKTKAVIIENEPFAKYMNISNIKADHVTLVLQHFDEEATPHFEIQLLHFHHPKPQEDTNIHRLDKLGYNHLCFAVEDIKQMIQKLKNHGVKIISDILDFHARKLVYVEGPDGIIIELAELKN